MCIKYTHLVLKLIFENKYLVYENINLVDMFIVYDQSYVGFNLELLHTLVADIIFNN